MAIFTAGRARLDVGPADIGRRLTVRYKGSGFGAPDRELVGVLDRWSGGTEEGILRIRKRDGEEVGVHVVDVLTMRVVRPEVSAYAMQRLCQDGWPPIEQQQLDNWTLRAARGATGRANSVRVAGLPDGALATRLAAVEAWYRDRGLPPKLQITCPSGLEEGLDDAGWIGTRNSRVMTISVSGLLNATSEAHERQDLDLEVRSEPNGTWLRLLPGYNDATAAEFEHITAAVRPAAFVYCRNSGGDLLGIGHATQQADWFGATTIETVPQARRTGIAKAITAQLAMWAREQGGSTWYLQLFEDNASALGLYEGLGFTTHHEYQYRWPGDVEEPWPQAELTH